MANNNNNEWANGLFDALAPVALGAVALYFVFKIVVFILSFFFSFLPLIIFYVLPFAVFTGVVGFILAAASSAFAKRQADFRAVAIVFPVLAAITLIFVGTPSNKEVQIREDGRLTIKRPIEWPSITYAYYHLDHAVSQDGNKWDWNGLYYDRTNVAWIAWLSLILGGPALFWVFSKELQELEDGAIKKELEAPLNRTIEEIRGKFGDLDRSNHSLSYALKERDEEIERLKLRDEYLTKKEQEVAGTPSGVLNSDVF